MNREWKHKIASSARAVVYGAALAALLGIVVFVVAWALNGMSWGAGYEWQARVVYIAAACGVLISGTGMFTAGGKTREEQLDPNNYEPLNVWERFPGIGWATALFWVSIGALAAETVVELVFYAIY